jgi:TonB family protein
MRWIPLSLLLACATPAPHAPPPSTGIDVPIHTQALIDAYRQRQAQQGAPATPARCPSEDSPLQLREKYLQAIDGCVEQAEPHDPTLAVGSRVQWPALYAALDAQREDVERCIREGYTWFDLWGTLTTRVELAADGTVGAVRTVRDDASTPAVACCVRRALRKVRLPAPGRPIALEHDSAFDAKSLHDRYGGSLAKDALRGVVAARSPELRTCYDAAVQEGLSHGGRVTLRFVIAPDGSVPRVAVVDDSVGSPRAACCVVEKLRGWQFPRPERAGALHVTYPFDLQLGS